MTVTARRLVRFVVALTFVAVLFVAFEGSAAPPVAHGQEGTATVAVGPQKSLSAPTTALVNPRTLRLDARHASAGMSESSTASISRFRAAKPGPARFIVDGAGTAIDRASVATRISAQRQGRHVAGAREYGGGSYFRSADDAQRVLDDFHSGAAEVLGVKGNDIVVRARNVTGFNHNPGAGYPNQATNVFFIKGSKSPSVVPYNPRWGG